MVKINGLIVAKEEGEELVLRVYHAGKRILLLCFLKKGRTIREFPGWSFFLLGKQF